MSDLLFVLSYIYFTEQHIFRVLLILQDKNFAYTESIENFRQNYISKKSELGLVLVLI